MSLRYMLDVVYDFLVVFGQMGTGMLYWLAWAFMMVVVTVGNHSIIQSIQRLRAARQAREAQQAATGRWADPLWSRAVEEVERELERAFPSPRPPQREALPRRPQSTAERLEEIERTFMGMPPPRQLEQILRDVGTSEEEINEICAQLKIKKMTDYERKMAEKILAELP